MTTRHRAITNRTNPMNELEDVFLNADELSLFRLRQYWLARALLYCKGLSLYFKKRFRNDDVLEFLAIDEESVEGVSGDALSALIKHQCETILTNTDFPRQGPIFDNQQKIANHFELSVVESEILLFAVILDLDSDYGDCFDLFGELSSRALTARLAGILDLAPHAVELAVQNKGLLHQSGLLQVPSQSRNMDRKFEMLDGLSNAMDYPHSEIDTLFTNYILPAPRADLQPNHYQHIAADYDRLKRYLAHASQNHLKGSNILLYGPPGTGKTQLIRVLAEHLTLHLFEISVENRNGNSLSGKERLTACQLAQKLFENRTGLCLLFDEIEDLFAADFFSRLFGRPDNASKPYKAWFNQLLENNPVPTIWISNAIDGMDDAFLRRFDVILEIDIPPRSCRERMLHEALHDTAVRPAWIARMANLEQLPPAVISRAARVCQILGDTSPAQVESTMENLVGNTLKAMGHPYKATPTLSSDYYNPDLINTRAPLSRITEGLQASGSGRLCLYGPPGTGKSAYAQYLANRLDQPLIAKRASEIINCYVGETEKNIAKLFAQATAEQGIILLDEADSFLRDRQSSQHRWESTQVNELLVQMEHFDGIFICSTNLMTELDSAALRRFDFKLEFNYLKADQAWQLLNGFLGDSLSTLGFAQQTLIKSQLNNITQLTPGDFAAVRRRLTVLGEQNNVSAFIEGLQEEAGFRKTPDRPIGFLAEF